MNTISDMAANSPKKKRPPIRTVLLILLVLSMPCGCCGWFYVLDAIPASVLPPPLAFVMDLFETEALIQNNSGFTVYVTPFTTTTGTPAVISQRSSIRQRDFKLRPGKSIILFYDVADLPLSGIAVCRAVDDCRLLATDYSNRYSINSFESLPALEPEWLAALKSRPEFNISILLFFMAGIMPILLFFFWRQTGRDEKEGSR